MKKLIVSIFVCCYSLLSIAEEGMLIPSLIAAFESDMKAKGMKLTAEQIYSINHSSLKDAVIHFGGGCTAEIISKKGLILTNHHCGYYNIQQHSSVEKDYLKNGFWAKNLEEELPNTGLTASRVVQIEDVTKEVLFGTSELKSKEEKMKRIQLNVQQLIKDKSTNSKFTFNIQEFDYGNSYYCLTTEVFQDVRLVGTPPNSIGKFGGDTDNWVWPRHTGDFSIFRIYAGPDNKPAAYSKNNVPYEPLLSLTIDAGTKKKGDFTMVYGYPGTTEQHLVSNQLNHIVQKERPARIKMRACVLSVIDEEMRASDKIRIKYAAKHASIANSYNKWIGQVQGLKEIKAIQQKRELENAYTEKSNTKDEWKVKYGNVVEDMNLLSDVNKEFDFVGAMYNEYLSIGPEVFKLVRTIDDLSKNYEKFEKSGELKEKVKNYKLALEKIYKDYDVEVDRKIFNQIHSEFTKQVATKYLTEDILKNDVEKWSSEIYESSIFINKSELIELFKELDQKTLKKLKKDPAYLLYSKLTTKYRTDILPKIIAYYESMDELLKVYVEGKLEMFPEEKHWPDANGTLRITYGKIEGSSPKDGLTYGEYTTIDGIIEKYRTGNPDFELQPRMIELYNNKDYGSYAQDNELWVCFSASNHTTGGNSGSPVLNENGELIGINFDRTWESTMSDYKFDGNRCRNVVCDIRYVLWVIDKYAGAQNIINELNIVR